MLRFSIGLACHEPTDPPVQMDAFYVEGDGALQAHPFRSHALPAREPLHLLIHTRLAFVVHRGDRESIRIVVSNDEPASGSALELMSICMSDGEAFEMDRYIVQPGAETEIRMIHVSDLRIREIPWSLSHES
jgi:hypothetical protein